MLNPQPTIEQLADMLVAKSSLSEKKPSYYETLPLLKKIDHLHNLIMMDGPGTNPGKSVIKRINDLKKELLELEEHPEMIPEMIRVEMSEKISLLINITQKRSRNNEMSNNENPNRPNSKRRRGGRNKRRRTLKRTRKYKW